jgi:hypothetical protein
MCGSQPHMRSRDVPFKPSGDYLFSEIVIECSNPNCSKEHRHFAPRPTRREAILAWNNRNRGGNRAGVTRLRHVRHRLRDGMWDVWGNHYTWKIQLT